MSEILANIVVEQNNINFQPDVNNINVTPEPINLNIFTAGAPGAGQSSNTELLFNNLNLIDGVPFTSYDGNKLTLGSPSNISITGGTNGYVLQTDGAGNLSWAAQTGGGGNGSPGGSNTQIQFNDGGVFGGAAGFTFDKSSNVANLPGDLNVAGNISGTILGSITNANYANFAGTVITNSQPNITSVGTLVNLTVTNPINGSVTGTAATITNAAQPNITSVGTLGNLVVAGAIDCQYGREEVNLIGANTGVFNFDVINGAINYSTSNATGNLTLNFRGDSTLSLNSILNTGQSITATYIMTTGTTPYQVSNVQVDGALITPKYVGFNSLVSNVITSYTHTIIKTAANAFTILGSITRYT